MYNSVSLWGRDPIKVPRTVKILSLICANDKQRCISQATVSFPVINRIPLGAIPCALMLKNKETVSTHEQC